MDNKPTVSLLESKEVSIDLLEPNKGQIEGVPRNPRFIRDSAFLKLKQSIQTDPEMLAMREILVYEHGGKYVIIGGNMRYRALKELGETTCIVKVIPPETTPEQLARITLKDNSGFGEWDFDLLANEWDTELIEDCCIELPGLDETLKNPTEEASEDDFDEEKDDVETICKAGDLWTLGEHRLKCGDSTNADDVRDLMRGEMADLWLTDPPYNVAVKNSQGMTIANDNMESGEFGKFLTGAFKAAVSVMSKGCPFYIWFASCEHINFEQAANRAGLKVRQELIWNKNAFILGRAHYQWKHEPCQPAGTMVQTPNGLIAIEDLKDGDEVLSWDKYSGVIKGYKKGGYKVQTANRQYEGLMYTVHAGDRMTRATDNHQFSVRFNASAKKNYCTYLMKRGKWYRVGIARGYDARQFGMKTRYHQEKAEAMWLLGVYEDKIEAQVQEQIITVKYGIPYTIWETDRFEDAQRSTSQISRIYDALDLDILHKNAIRLLHDFNRNYKYPLICEQNKADRFSTRVTAKICACNLVPGLMQLPIPHGKPSDPTNFAWEEIASIEAKPFEGEVYSLAVEKYEHYIADGIITHNCLYGWKGDSCKYFTDSRSQSSVIEDDHEIDIDKMSKKEMQDMLRQIFAEKTATTVINEKKPTKDADHPTMKPVRLFGYLISNSSRKGGIVLDSFGGSGTTMVACEQLGRRARLMEYDPHYCDVIIARWEKLTGRKAERAEREAE